MPDFETHRLSDPDRDGRSAHMHAAFADSIGGDGIGGNGIGGNSIGGNSIGGNSIGAYSGGNGNSLGGHRFWDTISAIVKMILSVVHVKLDPSGYFVKALADGVTQGIEAWFREIGRSVGVVIETRVGPGVTFAVAAVLVALVAAWCVSRLRRLRVASRNGLEHVTMPTDTGFLGELLLVAAKTQAGGVRKRAVERIFAAHVDADRNEFDAVYELVRTNHDMQALQARMGRLRA